MEPDLELSIASMAEESFVVFTEEDMNAIKEVFKRVAEETDRKIREKKARGEISEGDAKMEEDWNVEQMNIIANKKMLRRRRERFMRHLRQRRKTEEKNKSKSSQDEESFMSDSDEEMIIAQEGVKRLTEKAIRGYMTPTLTARDEDGDAAKMEDFKAEEMNIVDEKMFPRRRGRLIRYLRRQRSKAQDSAFEIEFHNLQLPMAEESFMGYSDEGMDKAHDEIIRENITSTLTVRDEVINSKSQDSAAGH